MDGREGDARGRGIELLEVRHSLRGGLRIPRVPPFDSIASYPGLWQSSYLPPDSSPRPFSTLSLFPFGRNLPEIPGRTAIGCRLYTRGYETTNNGGNSFAAVAFAAVARFDRSLIRFGQSS